MEVAIGNNNTPPFQREVREWQHIDPTTGALLTGRLEADRWVNGPMNTYGKVSANCCINQLSVNDSVVDRFVRNKKKTKQQIASWPAKLCD